MIIGFGGRLGSGKSLLSNELVKIGFIKLSFADYLKSVLAECFSFDKNILYLPEEKNKILNNPIVWDQKSASRLFSIVGINDYKLEINKKIFKTRREMMQFIGTDILRAYDDNFHIKKTIEGLSLDKDYVCDDFRYLNELNALKQKGATSYYLIRPSNFEISNHESEISLNWTNFDNHIINDKSAKNLIKNFLKSIRFTNYKTKEIFNYNRYCFLYSDKESAYYAGLLAANKCLKKNNSTSYFIEIKSNNLEILNGFKNYIKSNNPIISKKRKNGKEFYLFKINCPYIIENLKYWNIKPSKNRYIEVPDIIKNNKEILKYWILGLIDGSGSINLNKKNKLNISIMASKNVIDFCKDSYNDLKGNIIICKNYYNLYKWKFYDKEAVFLYEKLHDPISLNKEWLKIKSFI